jgi:hypothetical protein
MGMKNNKKQPLLAFKGINKLFKLKMALGGG